MSGSDDMGLGILKTMGKYILSGIAGLGAVVGLGWLGMNILRENQDPTFYIDQASVRPKHNLVLERVSPEVSIAADFNSKTVYTVKMFSKDTTHYNVTPFEKAVQDSATNAFLQRAAGYLHQGKQRLAK